MSKRPAAPLADQAETSTTTVRQIMGHPNFKVGVEDVRAGRPVRFDQYSDGWEYERGRQWAMLAPVSMPLRVRGKLNLQAVWILSLAFSRREIV
jgi:hypothetical protein